MHAYMHLQKIQCTVLGWGWGGLNSVTLNQFSTPFDWRWFRQISIFDLARSGPQSSPLTAGLFSLFHVSLQYCFIPPSPEGMWQAEVGPCRTVLGVSLPSNPTPTYCWIHLQESTLTISAQLSAVSRVKSWLHGLAFRPSKALTLAEVTSCPPNTSLSFLPYNWNTGWQQSRLENCIFQLLLHIRWPCHYVLANVRQVEIAG